MSLEIKCSDSAALWTFQTVNDWRNGYLGRTRGYIFKYREDMSCPEIFFKRLASECVYPFLFVAAVVEFCFRMAIGYILDLLLCMCVSEENNLDFQIDYNDKTWGLLADSKIPAPLVIIAIPFALLAVLIGNIFMKHLEVSIIYQNTFGCCFKHD